MLLETDNSFDEQLKANMESACQLLPNVDIQLSDENIRSRYINLSFDILTYSKDKDDFININYLNDVKNVFQFVVSLGILENLIPGVGIQLEKRCKNANKIPKESITVEEQYSRLSVTTKRLLSCLEIRELRNFIMANHLNDLFAGLLQLTQAPLKKPNNSAASSSVGFCMTELFYKRVLDERIYFEKEFNKLLFKSYAPQVIQELMLFYGNTNSPRWLKAFVYKILILKVQEQNGVESLVKALFDSETCDTGTKWQQYDLLVKILLTKPSHVEEKNYYTNICSQILQLLSKKDHCGRNITHYEQIVAVCIKFFYEKDNVICYNYFLNDLIQNFTRFTSSGNPVMKNEIVTEQFTELTTLWYNCFVPSFGMVTALPAEVLTPIITVIFNVYIAIYKSILSDLTEKLRSIIIRYINATTDENKKNVFESLLFCNNSENGILKLQENIEFTVNNLNEIEIIRHDAKLNLSPLLRADCFLNLVKCKHSDGFVIPLCIYLLEISVNQLISSGTELNSSANLLHLETESDLLFMTKCTEKKLVAYSILSNIIEEQHVQQHFKKHPENILNFIEKTLLQFVKNGLHKTTINDSEEYQNMFILIMIVRIIVENTLEEDSLSKYSNLKTVLNRIYRETSNEETKKLIARIYDRKTQNTSLGSKMEISSFDQALEDLCDPLLPIRGHALLILSKLIENSDPEACSQKQYLLSVAQQHLKNEDSFIYLNAIKLLSSLGDSFPDIVLNTLTEEYSDSTKDVFEKDAEVRIKTGEVLLRIVKSLGEIAPKYKAILLNTFLSGVRDDDHLIRASSLSNLGEVCKVLGFKLGSVVTEVLWGIQRLAI